MSSPQPASPPLVPRHIAIIMDGNGRWAARRGLPRAAGHRAGVQAVRRTIESVMEHGVEWLTLFAFSSENWRRSADEVTDLTFLLRHYLRSELRELAEAGVRLRFIGERGRFGAALQAELADAETKTQRNRKLNLVIALSYGARAEIAAAARRIATAAAVGSLDPATIDESVFAAHLATAGMPDPDLVIRTSGEQRLSNFLLWQAAYAELIFDEALWPDFGAPNLDNALAEYARRERRFGARPGPVADASPSGSDG